CTVRQDIDAIEAVNHRLNARRHCATVGHVHDYADCLVRVSRFKRFGMLWLTETALNDCAFG
ncbi:MAG: hypothetical protein AAF152_21135, partial [Cyanobacteria bacterium P01_A01_bin.114]